MQTKESLSKNIEYRITEVEGYQTNIDNYVTMVGLLPAEWPEYLTQYAQTPPAELFSKLDEADIVLVSDLQFRLKLQISLLTEKIEQRKAQCVLDALRLQLKGLENVS